MVHELLLIDHHADVRRVAADHEEHHVTRRRRVNALSMLYDVAAQCLGVLCPLVLVTRQIKATVAHDLGHKIEARHRAGELSAYVVAFHGAK